MKLYIRGRTILCHAKANQRKYYLALYNGLTDEQLDKIKVDTRDQPLPTGFTYGEWLERNKGK